MLRRGTSTVPPSRRSDRPRAIGTIDRLKQNSDPAEALLQARLWQQRLRDQEVPETDDRRNARSIPLTLFSEASRVLSEAQSWDHLETWQTLEAEIAEHTAATQGN